MAASSDLNLLYGILALQLDFIRHEHLIAAMQAWINRKQASLGEILVEQGALAAENHQLLAALVQKHLQQHNNDPQQSLAAVSSADAARQNLIQLADADVQASLGHLSQRPPAAPAAERDIYATQAVSIGETSSKGSRFRILRPHARGGLGEVSVANDTELNREVALKEIQVQFADDLGSRDRFMLEAQITGGLEHPGIVPVYGLGAYADGRPFYAMRFVRGSNLHEALEAFHHGRKEDRKLKRADYDSLAFRQLLGRFIDVCQAIAYAHSRGILHRDLKPGNIMLGQYGETLVVDWGLAKPLGKAEQSPEVSEPPLVPSSDGSSMPTQMGSAIGTLAYMSPEQAAGRLDQLGPGTDIYALGATLYHLLAGHAPHRGNGAGEIIRRITAGDFPAAHTENRHIPPALSAICQRAMALRPADRYSTALALAEDVEQFLADEPTSAYREPLTQRARRWAKRHRTLVVTTSAVVLLGTVFLGALALVIGRANERLAGANKRLDDANQKLKIVNLDLEAASAGERAEAARAQLNALLAKENAELAEEQSQLALQTLNSVVFDIQTKLENVPAAHEVRRSLLEEALEGLERIGEKLSTRAAADRNAATAQLALGDVMLRVGDADGVRGLSAAAAMYEQANATFRRLAAAEPGNAAAQRDLALSYHNLGNVKVQQGDTPAALAAYVQCLEISQRLAAADASNRQAQRDLSIALEKIGDMKLQQGDTPGALAAYQEGLKIGQRLAAADPNDALVQRELAVSCDKLGDLKLQQGDTAGALASYQQGLEISQRLAAANPDDARGQRDLSVLYNKLGSVKLQQGDTAGALAAYQKGLEIRQRLLAQDPGDMQGQRDLLISYDRLGDVKRQQGDTAAALADYELGLEISQRLATADPSDAQGQRDMGVFYNKIGDVKLRQGDRAGALAAYQKDLEISDRLATADPSNAPRQRDLSIAYERLGNVKLQQGDLPGAEGAYEQALEIGQRLAAADPSNALVQRGLSFSHEKLGNLKLLQGNATGARASYQRCLEIRQRLAAADASDARGQRDLSVAFERLGDVSLQAADIPGALAAYEQSLAIRQRLAAADPGDAQLQRDLSVSHNKLGDVRLQQGDSSGALAAYRQGLELSQPHAEADPSDAQAQRDWWISHYRIGSAAFGSGEFAAAEGALVKAMAVLESFQQRAESTLFANELNLTKADLVRARAGLQATEDPALIAAAESDLRPRLLYWRVKGLCAAKDFSQAAEAAESLHRLASEAKDDADAWMLSAGGRAFLAGKLTAEAALQPAPLKAGALDDLEQSVEHGFGNLKELRTNPDFVALRGETRFQALLADLEARRSAPGGSGEPKPPSPP